MPNGKKTALKIQTRTGEDIGAGTGLRPRKVDVATSVSPREIGLVLHVLPSWVEG